MSTSGRQLRRRRKVQDVNDDADFDDQITDSEKISGGSTGSRDAQSDTLSSDQNNGRHKNKRRMIRRTGDFQNLDRSTRVIDDDSKVTVKKIKKSKKAGFLPVISNITEEYDILQKKIKKKRAKKQATKSPVREISPRNISCSTVKKDADTSVPSDGNMVEGDVQDETKINCNNSKRRHRRRKRVQFNVVPCFDQNASTDNCESDVKSSDVSDPRERFSNTASKSASDSDSVIYTFRNRKNLVSVESSVPTSIVSPKGISDKSDDSVEYTFKKRQGKKRSRKSPEGKEEKPIITSSNKQKKSKEKSYSKVLNKTDLLDTDNINKQEQPKCVTNMDTADSNNKITTPLAKQQKALHVTILHPGESLRDKKSQTPITKPSTPKNKETSEDIVPRKLKRKSVRVNADKLSNTLDNDNSEKRRNTYELNKSITNISVLKSCVVENKEWSGDNTLKPITDEKHIDTALQMRTTPTILNKTEHSLNKRSFELEQSTTDLMLLKPTLHENTPQDDKEEEVEKRRPFSNTPFSKVTKRKKVDAPVKLIDDVSPPENIALPSTTDESFEEDHQNIIGIHTGKSISKFNHCMGESNQSLLLNKTGSLSQSDQNVSSFGVSSTPLPKREGTYTLLKAACNSKSKLSSQTKDLISLKNQSGKKPSSRIKMPNFSLIHKKAFEKMEDIEHLQQRKAERAKLLLSGAKPILGSKLQSPKNKNILKPLNFGTDPLKPSNAFESPKPLRNGLFQKTLVDSPKILRPNLQSPKVMVKPAVQKTNLKPYVNTNAKINVQNNGTQYNITNPLRTGFTRYGFKTNSDTKKIVTKEEQIKAIANKNNVIQNNVTGRRNIIHGVRSNRRFELLMKMRNKT